MIEYELYVESGPQQRKTQVHVLALLGCTAQGATTEEALAKTPDAIREYKRFLQQHGEEVAPDEEFTVKVAAHIMEGSWIGNGDPTPGFEPDFQPLTETALIVYRQRLVWIQDGLMQLIVELTPEQLTAPPKLGRSIMDIIEHLTESEAAYLRYTVGTVEGLSAALKAIQQGPENLTTNMGRYWRIINDRLEVMTAIEREQTVPHGQLSWTARRGLRRMLEHGWEHLREIATRFGVPVVSAEEVEESDSPTTEPEL